MLTIRLRISLIGSTTAPGSWGSKLRIPGHGGPRFRAIVIGMNLECQDERAPDFLKEAAPAGIGWPLTMHLLWLHDAEPLYLSKVARVEGGHLATALQSCRADDQVIKTNHLP